MRWTEGGQPALGFHAVAVFDPLSATIGASALISAGTSIYGANKAADSAEDAANRADARYATTRGDLMPYNQTGQNALAGAYNLASSGQFGGGRDYLTEAYNARPGSMTQAELEATPGYAWNLAQGLKAVQGAAAARGLGVSGASLKGAANFATGLSNSTYKDQFNIRQQQFSNLVNLNNTQQGNLTNQFNRYNALASLGENAAAQTGTQGTALANTAAQYTNAAGVNEATGLNNTTNALNQGVENYLAYNKYKNNTGTGGYSNSYEETSGKYL